LKIVLKYKELLILIFAVFVSMLGFGLVMPLLPLYAAEFPGATKTHIGLMLGVFSIVKIVVAPIGGNIADKYGRKPVMVGGMFSYMIVMALFGLAQTLPELFIYRGAQGAASALVWPIAMTYIGDIVREEDRGKAMGLYSMSFASGNVVGPILGGVIATYFSLSVPFFFTSALAAMSGLLLFFGVKESYEGSKKERTSKKSSFHPSLDFRSLGKNLHPVRILKIPANGILWIWNYLKKITPFPKIFLGLTIGSFTVFFGLAMVWSMLALFGEEILGLSAIHITLVFTLIGSVQFLIMFPAGSLSDRIGRKKLILSGATVSAVFSGLIGLSTGFLFLLFATGLYTVGRALARPSFPAFVSSLSLKENRGKMMGVYNFAQNAAFATGSFLGGAVADMMGLRWPFFVAMFVGISGSFFIAFTVTEPDKASLKELDDMDRLES
ncbi:MAG: MFS transporter, partial [Candidatus Natronoplasma sp.]